MLGSACYIEGAMSSMLLLALEFADDFEGGVLANANCGGKETGKKAFTNTVELQWLEHLWNQENMFETGLVGANEC